MNLTTRDDCSDGPCLRILRGPNFSKWLAPISVWGEDAASLLIQYQEAMENGDTEAIEDLQDYKRN